jgi:hypothetical protein
MLLQARAKVAFRGVGSAANKIALRVLGGATDEEEHKTHTESSSAYATAYHVSRLLLRTCPRSLLKNCSVAPKYLQSEASRLSLKDFGAFSQGPLFCLEDLGFSPRINLFKEPTFNRLLDKGSHYRGTSGAQTPPASFPQAPVSICCNSRMPHLP